MISIAIDGPSGAGKSSISRKLSSLYGFVYVDTGAFYRAVGLYFLNEGIGADETQKIIAGLEDIWIDIKFIDSEQRVFLNGVDVSDKIRTPEVSMMASAVSAIGRVREFLFDLQQSLARKHNVIMDGRDIGTVVLPNATLKIFLTASDEERARRRFGELIAKGMSVTYEDVLADLKLRDKNDSSREIAPLKPADDAIIVNTTGNTFERSVAILSRLISQKLNLRCEENYDDLL